MIEFILVLVYSLGGENVNLLLRSLGELIIFEVLRRQRQRPEVDLLNKYNDKIATSIAPRKMEENSWMKP